MCISFREQERKVSSRIASYKAGIQARSRSTCAILMESRGYMDDILREGSMRAGAQRGESSHCKRKRAGPQA